MWSVWSYLVLGNPIDLVLWVLYTNNIIYVYTTKISVRVVIKIWKDMQRIPQFRDLTINNG